MNGAWIDPHVEMLHQLWKTGESASVVAGRLNRKFGTKYSRNAVIGKVHRMGWDTRATLKRKPMTKRPRRQRPAFYGNPLFRTFAQNHAQANEAYVELVIPERERKTIETLEDDDCRWPIGDPQHADFHFCGKNKVPGLPYCEFHCFRAYQPPPSRRSTVLVFPTAPATSTKIVPEEVDA